MSEVVIEKDGRETVIEKNIIVNQNAGVDQIPADWNQIDNTKPDFIKNKPVIPGAPAWGEIGGDIGNQSDLMTMFNTKENKNRTILDSDNFDEVTANGKYSANYGTIMLDVANAYAKVFQRVVYQANNTEKFRWQAGGEWSAWVTLTGKMDKEPTIMPNGSSYNDLTENGVYVDSNYETFLHVSNLGGFILQVQQNVYNGISFRMTLEGVFNDWTTLVTLGQLDNKVDKVNGKGLSTNDYTTTEKNKLAGIEAGAQVNVIPTWNSVTDKPETFPPAAHTHSGMVTSSTVAEIVTLTQAAYDALNPKVTTTLYVITGA